MRETIMCSASLFYFFLSFYDNFAWFFFKVVHFNGNFLLFNTLERQEHF